MWQQSSSLAFNAVLGFKETLSVSKCYSPVFPAWESSGFSQIFRNFWKMSCNEVFNFLLKTGGKLMCLLQGAPRQQQHWGCLLQPPLFFTVLVSLRLTQPHWLYQRGPCWKDTVSSGGQTCFQYRIIYKFSVLNITTKSIQFWLKHKWQFSFKSAEFQNVASNWHCILLSQCWSMVFLLEIGEITRFTEESWQLLFNWPDEKFLYTSLLNLCFWDVKWFQDFLE